MANKIKVKRGKEVNLPILDVGEPAFTTDTKKPFIGSDTGNIELATKEQINSLEAEFDVAVGAITEDSEVVLARGGETTLGVRLDKQASELSNIATQTDEHLESAMPHEFTSLKTGKKYRYGRQVSADGIPQIISEEVV